MENSTQARKREAHLLTYLTPTNTTATSKRSRIEPYSRMLFNMTGDVAPPPDRTSPKGDMDGAMYVCKKSIINYSFNIEQLETKA